MIACHTALPVREPGDPGEARRRAVVLAGELGFDEQQAGRVALVVTEAASNILKHAAGGEILLGKDVAAQAIEVLAIDRGAGMTDIARCFQDGYSTAGSPGTGLGAIQRMASAVDLYSRPGAGTVLLARIAVGVAPRPAVVAAAVCRAVDGERVCGDGWAVVETGERTVLAVVDGLGHGKPAAEAADLALHLFRAHAGDPIDQLLGRIHDGLRSTRGAAMAIAELRAGTDSVSYAGIGNISATVRSGTSSRQLVSHNGTLGAEVRKIQVFTTPFPVGARLIMHSDGLATHWDLDRYPGLLARDPAVVAAALYRDFSRGRDDVTVLVAARREADR